MIYYSTSLLKAGALSESAQQNAPSREIKYYKEDKFDYVMMRIILIL